MNDFLESFKNYRNRLNDDDKYNVISYNKLKNRQMNKHKFFVTYTYKNRIRYTNLNDDKEQYDEHKFNWYKKKSTITTEFKCTRSQLEYLISVDVKKNANTVKLDSDIEIVSELVEFIGFKIHSAKEFMNKIDMHRTKMKQCDVLKYDYMPEIDDISFETTEMKCVYQCLEKRYKNAKRPVTKNMFEIFQEFSRTHYRRELTMSEGVDCNMLLYFCQKKDITFLSFDVNNKRMCKYICKNRNFKPLVIFCCDEHMYIVTDDKVVDSIIKSNADHKVTSQLFKEERKKDVSLPFYEYEGMCADFEYYNWDKLENKLENMPIINDAENAVGHLVVNDNNLNEVFNLIVRIKKVVPKVRHRDKNNICQIAYKRKDRKIVYIQTDPNYRTRVTWKDVKALCEKIDVPFTNQGMGTLMKTYYEQYAKPHRVDIDKKAYFEEHGKKCCRCGASHSLQLDHIVPVANGGTNTKDNIQQLCKGCHYLKSRQEQEDGYIKYSDIASSFNNNVKDIFNSDVAKKWAFIEKLGDKNYCHFEKNAFDMIKCRKNIMYYYELFWCVFTVMDDIESFDGVVKTGFYFVESQNTFPLRGNGWYSEHMVNYCLQKCIIKMEDVKLQLIPSLTLPPDYFKAFIDEVYSKFGDMSKVGINALIGCFYRQVSTQVKARYCKSKKDACYLFNNDHTYNATIATYLKECDLYQILHETQVDYEETEAPIYLQILDEEAIEMHKLSVIIGKACFVNTDCIYSINNVDVSMYEWERGVPKYRVIEGVEHPRYEALPKYCRTDNIKIKEKKYNVIEDLENVSELAHKVVELEGCLINGRAGTGKSYLVNEIVKLLDNNYKCLAPTNKAARIICGQTIHKFCGANGKRLSLKYLENYEYIIVDEVSMIQEVFYKLFISIKNMRPDIKFIIVGDFEQLAPVNDRVKDCDYENSRVLYELVGGNKLTLEKCRRSDDILFNICKDVDNVDIEEFTEKECRRSLAFTNKKRIKVNAYWMVKEAKTNKHLLIDKHKYDPNSQDMLICVGAPIIARVTDSELEIANNEEFIVEKIKKNVIILDNGLEVHKTDFNKYFYPAYCITIHKSQGSTFEEEYTIYEWSRLDKRLRYVALSRATRKENIHIV